MDITRPIYLCVLILEKINFPTRGLFCFIYLFFFFRLFIVVFVVVVIVVFTTSNACMLDKIPAEIGFDISRQASPKGTICMKCQSLFSEKHKTKTSVCCLQNLPREWWRSQASDAWTVFFTVYVVFIPKRSVSSILNKIYKIAPSSNV